MPDVILDTYPWTAGEHRAAAAALGLEATMLMDVARETSDDRAPVYGLVISWLVRRAVYHAKEALAA